MPDNHRLPAETSTRAPSADLPRGMSPTPSLAKFLSSPTRLTAAGDTEVGPWKPPASAPATVRDEAARISAEITAGLAREAGEETIRQWLIRLGRMVAQTKTGYDATATAGLFASQLWADRPAIALFSEISLRGAARRFEFFPGYKGLSDHLADERSRLREEARRCDAIARGQQPVQGTGPTGYREPTAEERERVAEMMAQAREAAARLGHDPDFIWRARLYEFRRTGKWYEAAGPKPGEEGCRCPAYLLGGM